MEEKASDERLQQRAARFVKAPVTVHSQIHYDMDTDGDFNTPEVTDCHVIGTCGDLEKPFLRLTAVSSRYFKEVSGVERIAFSNLNFHRQLLGNFYIIFY